MKKTGYRTFEYTIVKMSDGEEILFIDAPDKKVYWVSNTTMVVESTWFGRHIFVIGEHTPFADDKDAVVANMGHCSRLEHV